jgi:hypothetical protein
VHGSMQASIAQGVGHPETASHSSLMSAVENVVPTWDAKGRLLLALPETWATRCSGVRLEIGGVLLPAVCTEQLSLHSKPGAGRAIVAAGRHHTTHPILTAELLPCKALPGTQDDEGRFELVLCVRWAPAPVGMQVRVRSHCVLMRLLYEQRS